MSEHIVDEDYRGHEIVFIKQDDGLVTVDIREDNFDGEFIGAYSDLIDVGNARNLAHGFLDGRYSVPAHGHIWRPLEITDDQPEQIYWCTGCDASKDSSGGIMV